MKKNILYVHYGDNWLRGSEHCLINLVTSLDSGSYRPFIWTNNRPLHELMLREGFQSFLSEFSLLLGWNKPKWSVSGWAKLVQEGYRLVKQHQIDLIHINSGAPCQWMVLVARLCRIPMVTQLHCAYPLRDRLSLGLHLSPKIITVSHAITHNLLADGYDHTRLAVIHNGIDIDKLDSAVSIDTKATLGLAKQSFLLATVGSLIPRKGVDRLIRCVSRLVPEYPDLHLLVIGDGPQKEALISLARYLDVSGHIHFVGEQSNVQSWLRGGADAFISGARSEAFGLVIAEAGLAGLPIIAPNVGGIPEVVRHNHSALLYEGKPIRSITSQITRVLESASLRIQLGSNARRSAVNRFSLQANTRAIMQHYRQQLSERRLA